MAAAGIIRVACMTCLAIHCGRGFAADEQDNPYHDPPPLQATSGVAACEAPKVRVLSADEARREAHQRIERGTSCWLAGACPPGGDYKDDDVVNEEVAATIARDGRFIATSIWVETLRKFVSLKGCTTTEAQQRELEPLVRAVPGVKLVWIETRVTLPTPRPRRSNATGSHEEEDRQ